jgi:hypothetical protein
MMMFDHVPAEKKKRKSKEYDFHPHYSQPIYEHGNFGFESAVVFLGCTGILIVIVTFMGLVLLYGGVTGIVYEVQEHQTLERLEQQGIVQTVPLIEVSLEGKADYEARYEFNGKTRKQDITQDQYRRLRGQDTVEILVDGNTTRIEGTKLEYYPLSLICMGGVAIPAGVLFSVIGLRMDWDILRIIYKKFRGHEKHKHDKPKRKRGLPEV